MALDYVDITISFHAFSERETLLLNPHFLLKVFFLFALFLNKTVFFKNVCSEKKMCLSFSSLLCISEELARTKIRKCAAAIRNSCCYSMRKGCSQTTKYFWPIERLGLQLLAEFIEKGV